jgi:CheY-like chemotaxis protein
MVKVDKKTILVADGNSTARKLLTVRLQSLEYETAEAGSAEEMEKLLASQTFDLAISDLKLPGNGGEEIMKKFHAKRTPVFVFTDRVLQEGQEDVKGPAVKAVFHRSQRSEMLLRIGEHFSSESDKRSEGEAKALQMLLIEDSPTIRGFLKRILMKHFPGSVVREAEDGRQAMSEMSNKRVDFIVTDLQMPGMDGQTFLKILHGNPVLKNKPVLVLSGSFTAQLQEELKAYPSVRTLAKPSSEEEIAQTIRSLMAEAEAMPRLVGGE